MLIPRLWPIFCVRLMLSIPHGGSRRFPRLSFPVFLPLEQFLYKLLLRLVYPHKSTPCHTSLVPAFAALHAQVREPYPGREFFYPKLPDDLTHEQCWHLHCLLACTDC